MGEVTVLEVLRKAHRLEKLRLMATDGEIGRVSDLFFSDDSWSMRYLVVKTGGWLTGRKVLIAPAALGEIDDEHERLSVNLSRNQIENSPPIDLSKPVSRQYEERFYRYYGWNPYWDPFPGPMMPPGPVAPPPSPYHPGEGLHVEDSHLRSAKEVEGYHIQASDGEIGHVHDFVIDCQEWVVRYLEVDTRNWLPGKKVLVQPAWIERISWGERVVNIDLTQYAIESAPKYDPSQVLTRDYEAALYKHYGKAAYWSE